VDRFQYLILMGLCVLVTVPLEVVIGARVWRRPRRLVTAVVPGLIVFSLWDVAAIAHHHWSYSRIYTTGWDLAGHLPVEEVVFFVVVPICALLTFEAVTRLLDRR
jgi:lycopene cyclase domain-containing protein